MKAHRIIISTSVYLFSILIYLVPISSNRTLITSPTPILDEAHILSTTNLDANPPCTSTSTTTIQDPMSNIRKEWKEIIQIFQNDYWGRNMKFENSHKSYRPFTVLTFRYFKYLFYRLSLVDDYDDRTDDGDGNDYDDAYDDAYDGANNTNNANKANTDSVVLSNLYLQRVVNIILHSSILLMMHSFIPSMIPSSSKLTSSMSSMSSISSSTMIYIITTITQLFFILHPTHCEIVVNIANRGHLLSILFGLLSCNTISNCITSVSSASSCTNNTTCTKSSTVWSLSSLAIIYCLGLLSSETFIFFLPILIITWIWMLVIQDDSCNGDDGGSNNGGDHHDQHDQQQQQTPLQLLAKIIHKLLPHITVITILSLSYLYIRHINDWISIPNGLIRRAENPFISFILHEEEGIGDTTNAYTYTNSYIHHKLKYHFNYIYILCIHIIKSMGMGIIDIIGLSHEYGYNCIPEIQIKTKEITIMTMMNNSNNSKNTMTLYYIDDERLWIVIGLILGLILLLIQFCSLFEKDCGGNDEENRSSSTFSVNENNNINRCATTTPPRQNNNNNDNHQKFFLGILLWSMFCIWILASLFPVSGFMKIGTFVADRLVVPSTVITSFFWGCFFSRWIISPLLLTSSITTSTAALTSTSTSTSTPTTSIQNQKTRPFYQIVQFMYRSLILFMILSYLSIKVYKRNQEWMTFKSLLESSLRTCPQSAKSNLELSKIYSGLYYHKKIYNLEKALDYITEAEEIDESYCDVHYQFGYIYIQQEEYLKFEERVTNGILCPFTMEGSHLLFQQYWSVMLNNNSDQGWMDAKKRYQKYVKIIQDAIIEEEKKKRGSDTNICDNKSDGDLVGNGACADTGGNDLHIKTSTSTDKEL